MLSWKHIGKMAGNVREVVIFVKKQLGECWLCSDSGRTAGLLFLYHSVTTSFPVCPVPPCTQPPAQHPACARQCSYCTRLVHREARGTNFSKWKKNLTSLFAGTWAKFNNCLCNFVIKCKMILSYDMQFIDFSFFFSMLCGYVW